MSVDFQFLKKNICDCVVQKLDFSKEQSETEIYRVIDDIISDRYEKQELTFEERLLLRTEVFNSLKRLDIIQEFLEDESVTEIMINGADKVFIEREGKLIETDKHFESSEKLHDVIQQIVASCNRSVNEASPIQDARLLSGERVNVVLNPVAINGPIVTIRRFPSTPITMEKLIELGSITKEAADFLRELVVAKYNIFISGGTGSGKTTFLNALSQFIPGDERIITVEDSAELQLLEARNLVKLEARGKTGEGCNPISIRELIKSALRMRPDRVIVGEVRGEEVIDMLAAMNTGHDGSLSTGHGNSAKDMIIRLETMVLCGMDIPIQAVRGQIAGGIDILIHLGRLRSRKRVVLEISELMGIKDGSIELHTIYKYEENGLIKVDELINNQKMRNL